MDLYSDFLPPTPPKIPPLDTQKTKIISVYRLTEL